MSTCASADISVVEGVVVVCVVVVVVVVGVGVVVVVVVGIVVGIVGIVGIVVVVGEGIDSIFNNFAAGTTPSFSFSSSCLSRFLGGALMPRKSANFAFSPIHFVLQSELWSNPEERNSVNLVKSWASVRSLSSHSSETGIVTLSLPLQSRAISMCSTSSLPEENCIFTCVDCL